MLSIELRGKPLSEVQASLASLAGQSRPQIEHCLCTTAPPVVALRRLQRESAARRMRWRVVRASPGDWETQLNWEDAPAPSPPVNRAWLGFRQFVREHFPFRIQKIPLDAGATCPNRDGTTGLEGCSYCENRSFSPYASTASTERLALEEQLRQGREFYRKEGEPVRFLAYLQAFTNTYAPIEVLRARFDAVLSSDEVIGLVVGTRPDCVADPVLDLLEEYADRRLVWVEYGLQSIHDRTLAAINRGHGSEEFLDAMRRTAPRNLLTCVHVILGLPGETREDMRKTAEALAAIHPDSVKIHHLYVCPGTHLEEEWRGGRLEVLSLEHFASLAADFLERLPPEVVIQRVCGELEGPYVLAPCWDVSKQQVLEAVQCELQRRGTRQGARYETRGQACPGS